MLPMAGVEGGDESERWRERDEIVMMYFDQGVPNCSQRRRKELDFSTFLPLDRMQSS